MIGKKFPACENYNPNEALAIHFPLGHRILEELKHVYLTNQDDLFLMFLPFFFLQSVPINILEDYNLTSMTLEYRRECTQSNVLESLTSMKPDGKDDQEGSSKLVVKNDKKGWECTHLLRMEADQAEIVRARSVWQYKQHRLII
mgnify:CR=1 FL=1